MLLIYFVHCMLKIVSYIDAYRNVQALYSLHILMKVCIFVVARMSAVNVSQFTYQHIPYTLCTSKLSIYLQMVTYKFTGELELAQYQEVR